MIADGHSDAWHYTPREIAGWLHFKRVREQRQRVEYMQAVRMAHHGDEKAAKAWVERMVNWWRSG